MRHEVARLLLETRKRQAGASMKYLLFFGPIAATGGVKLMVLILPLALTSLTIGVQEWNRRTRRVSAERRIARSLWRALRSGRFTFEAAPGRPFVNVFQGNEDKVEMPVILSPRSVVRAKLWWGEHYLPAEPESRILRVYMLGPASTPDSRAPREPKDAILLPVAEDPPSAPASAPPALPRTGRILADFSGICPTIAESAPGLFGASVTASNAQRSEFISGELGKEVVPEIGCLMPPAIPIAGFRQESLRGYSTTPTWRTTVPVLTGATAIARVLPVLRSEPVKNDLPAGDFVEVGGAERVQDGVAMAQREPFFFITPAVRFARARIDGAAELYSSIRELKKASGWWNVAIRNRLTNRFLPGCGSEVNFS